MQKNKKTLNFKKAIFPAIMTILSFVFFVFMFLSLNIATTQTKDIEKYERVLRLGDYFSYGKLVI